MSLTQAQLNAAKAKGWNLYSYASQQDYEYAINHPINANQSAASQNWGADYRPPTPTVAPPPAPNIAGSTANLQSAQALVGGGSYSQMLIDTSSHRINTATRKSEDLFSLPNISPGATSNFFATRQRGPTIRPGAQVSIGGSVLPTMPTFSNPAPSRVLSGTEDFKGRNATHWAETFKWAQNRGTLPLQITVAEAPVMSRYITGSDQATADWLYKQGYRYDVDTASYFRVAAGSSAPGGGNTGGGYGYGGGGGGGGGDGYSSPFSMGLINWRI